MRGHIYKIECEDRFYYGSCSTTIQRRTYTHRYRAARLSNKLYDFIKDKAWSLTLVETVEVENKRALCAKEDEYVRPNLSNPLCLNERSATWDYEKDQERKKKWYRENAERICEKQKLRYANKTATPPSS